MACPICKEPTDRTYRPFCSRRCADLDLGRWVTGAYSIPAAPDDPDTPQLPTEAPENDR